MVAVAVAVAPAVAPAVVVVATAVVAALAGGGQWPRAAKRGVVTSAGTTTSGGCRMWALWWSRSRVGSAGRSGGHCQGACDAGVIGVAIAVCLVAGSLA